MKEWISKWLSPRGCALDLSLQHTHCFQSKQRASAWGISRGWSGLSLFPRPGERAASSSQEGCLASCLYPHTTWARWKEMLTCCLSLRGLVKPNGMRSSQLFNLLRRKEFYEDNNMLSLIREKPAQCSWRVGALILKSFFFFSLVSGDLHNSVFLADARHLKIVWWGWWLLMKVLSADTHWVLLSLSLGFPDSSVDKESVCSTGDPGSIPGLGRSPGEEIGYPLQYSGPENSMDYIVYGFTKSRTRLSNCHL